MRFEDVSRLLAALDQHGVRYVMIGSMAMAAHGIVRATQDIGFFVDPAAGNVARLRAALRAVFVDDSIEEITSEDLAGEYPVVREASLTWSGGWVSGTRSTTSRPRS